MSKFCQGECVFLAFGKGLVIVPKDIPRGVVILELPHTAFLHLGKTVFNQRQGAVVLGSALFGSHNTNAHQGEKRSKTSETCFLCPWACHLDGDLDMPVAISGALHNGLACFKQLDFICRQSQRLFTIGTAYVGHDSSSSR